jgi:hypothetical protein
MKERSVPIRPGIEDHLVCGDMSLCEFGVYVLIHIQADYRTGIWRGSAPRILATAPRGASLRQIQRTLEHFEQMGYLKSFRVPGVRGNTPYLIDKFTVRSGALKGRRLNAAKSDSWRNPYYEVVAEDDAVPVAEGVALHDALSRSKKEEVRSKNKGTAAKTAAPPDPRFQPFLNFAFRAFTQKLGQKPTWGGRDFKALAAMLAANRSLEAAELERRFGNYLDSTEAFTAKFGGSLAYFCAHTDSFLAGPILERNKANGNYFGKASNVEATLDGYRQLQQARTN